MKKVLHIINLKPLIISALAVASTYFCIEYSITADYPLTLIATAVIFPIVFSINSAYKRRESVLDDYSLIKAHGRAIYFASRDWLADGDPARTQLVSERSILRLENLRLRSRRASIRF